MTIKIAVYGGLGFFLLIIIVLLVFGVGQKSEVEKTDSDLFPTPSPRIHPVIPQILKAEPLPVPSFSSLFEGSLLKPVFLEPVLEIKELIKPVKKEAVFSLLPPESPSLSFSPPVLTPEQEKEIFDKLYPDYFRDSLQDIQNVFIEQVFLPADYQKIENFDSEENIFSFVNTGINVFERQGWYSKEEAEKSRKGVNEIWKNLMEKEKLEFQKKFIKSDFYQNIFANRIYYSNKIISQNFRQLFKSLKQKFLNRAYAQFLGSVGDLPGECWRAGPPLPSGANIISLCCDCGLGWSGKKLIYIHHCGIKGEVCVIHFGCLNKIARIGMAAIWDPTTRICGVG